MRAIAFILLFVAAPAFAADWPQWLGPNRDASTDADTVSLFAAGNVVFSFALPEP